MTATLTQTIPERSVTFLETGIQHLLHGGGDVNVMLHDAQHHGRYDMGTFRLLSYDQDQRVLQLQQRQSPSSSMRDNILRSLRQRGVVMSLKPVMYGLDGLDDWYTPCALLYDILGDDVLRWFGGATNRFGRHSCLDVQLIHPEHAVFSRMRTVAHDHCISIIVVVGDQSSVILFRPGDGETRRAHFEMNDAGAVLQLRMGEAGEFGPARSLLIKE